MTCRCGREHPESGYFFVTAKYGQGVAILAGPYETHEEALDALPKAKSLSLDAIAEAAFASFGTTRIAGYEKPGQFNDQITEGED